MQNVGVTSNLHIPPQIEYYRKLDLCDMQYVGVTSNLHISTQIISCRKLDLCGLQDGPVGSPLISLLPLAWPAIIEIVT